MNTPSRATTAPLLPLRHSHGIIAALDLPTAAQVRDVVAATASVDGVAGYKLGPSTVLELGLPGALRLIAEHTDLPVIYDHQKAGLDIPSNAEVFARTLGIHGVAAAIVFPLAGPTSAARFVSALHEHGVAALTGGHLPIHDYTVSGGGWVSDDVLENITDIALAHREIHLIAPIGERVEMVVKRAAGAGVRPRLFVPGIGSAGIELGALSGVVERVAGLYPIVGRAVSCADDPADAAARLAATLDTVVATAGGIR